MRKVLIIGVVTILAHADQITLYNQTPRDLYAAIYQFDGKVARINTPIISIGAESSATMERPARKFKNIATSGFFFDRELVFVEDEELLTPELTAPELKMYRAKNVGTFKGTDFYITDKGGVFQAYNFLEWNTLVVPWRAYEKLLVAHLSVIKNNLYKNKIAYVRVGNQLAQEEYDYLKIRLPKVKKNLETFISTSMKNKYVPKIAIIASGGGCRALFYTTGCLASAFDAGLLDTTTYLVGLSGSSWAIATWISRNLSLQQFSQDIVNQFEHGISDVSSQDAWFIMQNIFVKYFYNQSLGIADLYGGLLANTLFSLQTNKQNIYLSDQAKIVASAHIPFPIYTAIGAENLAAEENWYEFTPYEIGARWLSKSQGMYIPTWAFGRKFKNGISVNIAPEQSLGFLLATFGFAIGLSVKKMIEKAELKDKLPNIAKPLGDGIIDRIMEEFGHIRPLYTKVYNFTRGMTESIIATKKSMKLIDAAINFNVPYPPISDDRPHRKADIIICCDASKQLDDLAKMQAYAKKRGYPFAQTNFNAINFRVVNVFKDENNPKVPVLIYIPRVIEKNLLAEVQNNPAYASLIPYLQNFDIEKCMAQEECATLNFVYPKQVAQSLTALGAFNMKAAIDTIKKEIAWVIEKKSIKI